MIDSVGHEQQESYKTVLGYLFLVRLLILVIWLLCKEERYPTTPFGK